MQISNSDDHNGLVKKKVNEEIEEIYVKIGNTLKKIFLSDIDWFGVDGKHAYAKTENRNYPLNISLKDLEEKLNSPKFMRIHQSFMVDIRKIDVINLTENTVSIKDEKLPIGRRFKRNLLSQINYF